MSKRGPFAPLKRKHVSYIPSRNSLDCLYRFIIPLSFMPNLCKIKGNWYTLLCWFLQSLRGNTEKKQNHRGWKTLFYYFSHKMIKSVLLLRNFMHENLKSGEIFQHPGKIGYVCVGKEHASVCGQNMCMYRFIAMLYLYLSILSFIYSMRSVYL